MAGSNRASEAKGRGEAVPIMEAKGHRAVTKSVYFQG